MVERCRVSTFRVILHYQMMLLKQQLGSTNEIMLKYLCKRLTLNPFLTIILLEISQCATLTPYNMAMSSTKMHRCDMPKPI